MDCRGMGAFVGACRHPLGGIGAILRAQYAEDVESLRLEYVREADALSARTDEEWGIVTKMDDEAAEFWELHDAYAYWLKYGARVREWWSGRVRPGAPCAFHGCHQRVRLVALNPACPEHHLAGYGASYRPVRLLPAPP